MTVSNNTIPSELIAIPRFDGYFYEPATMVVYSLKVTGTLTPLKFRPGVYIRGGRYIEAGYQLSRKGKKINMSLQRLKELVPHEYQVPYLKAK